METDEEVLCSSCESQKKELFPVKSKLVGAQLYMCRTCIDAQMEPRWAIIMAGRTRGIASVRQYIVQHLYQGEVIKASEIV